MPSFDAPVAPTLKNFGDKRPRAGVVSAIELMFLLKPIEQPLDGVSLFFRGGEIVLEDRLEDLLEVDREHSLGSGVRSV